MAMHYLTTDMANFNLYLVSNHNTCQCLDIFIMSTSRIISALINPQSLSQRPSQSPAPLHIPPSTYKLTATSLPALRLQ